LISLIFFCDLIIDFVFFMILIIDFTHFSCAHDLANNVKNTCMQECEKKL